MSVQISMLASGHTHCKVSGSPQHQKNQSQVSLKVWRSALTYYSFEEPVEWDQLRNKKGGLCCIHTGELMWAAASHQCKCSKVFLSYPILSLTQTWAWAWAIEQWTYWEGLEPHRNSSAKTLWVLTVQTCSRQQLPSTISGQDWNTTTWSASYPSGTVWTTSAPTQIMTTLKLTGASKSMTLSLTISE